MPGNSSVAADTCGLMQVLRHMCEGLVALLMDRTDYHKFMMRSVARDLLASLVFRPIMQHMTPYNINKVLILATGTMHAHPTLLHELPPFSSLFTVHG